MAMMLINLYKPQLFGAPLTSYRRRSVLWSLKKKKLQKQKQKNNHKLRLVVVIDGIKTWQSAIQLSFRPFHSSDDGQKATKKKIKKKEKLQWKIFIEWKSFFFFLFSSVHLHHPATGNRQLAISLHALLSRQFGMYGSYNNFIFFWFIFFFFILSRCTWYSIGE